MAGHLTTACSGRASSDSLIISGSCAPLMPGVRLLLSGCMIEEDGWYYDNKLEPDKLNAHLSCVERVYGLGFDQFAEADWASLARIYRLLPGWLRFGDDGCPYWFGVDEDVPPYLWASVEPSGLLVHGVLAPADWERWDSQFRELAVALPRQRIV